MKENETRKTKGQRKDQSNMKSRYNKNKSYNNSKPSKTNTDTPRKDGAYVLDTVMTNDPKYYNKIKSLFDPAIKKIGWAERIGNKVPFNEMVNSEATSILDWKPLPEGNAMPGICRINFNYGPGKCGTLNDAVNDAVTNLMSELYAKNSSSNLRFTQADLAQFLVGMASAVELIAEAKRILSVPNFWIDKNINYPRALCSALGFDYNDIITKRANYIAKLNSYIINFNSLMTPHFVDLFPRMYGLGNDVFVDENDEYGQIYVFCSNGYYVYDDTTGNLDWNKHQNFNMPDLFDAIDKVIYGWRYSSNYYLISGCIKRAFGDIQNYMIAPINENDMIAPVADKNFLMQIANMTILGKDTLTNMNVTQSEDKVTIVWDPTYLENGETGSNFTNMSSTLMLRHFDRSENITDDDNMEMTRLTQFIEKKVSPMGSGYVYELVATQPVLVTDLEIYAYDRSTGTVDMVADVNGNVYQFGASYQDGKVLYNLGNFDPTMLMLQPFRYVPTILIGIPVYDTAETKFVGSKYIPLGDMYNYTYLNKNDFERIQTAAMYSLYNYRGI